MSELRNFCLDGKMFFILRDHYPKVLKFSGYERLVHRKNLQQTTENQKDMLWITKGFKSF